MYEQVADARASDLDGAVLAAAGVEVGEGALDRLGDAVPGDGPVALVADSTVAGLHGASVRRRPRRPARVRARGTAGRAGQVGCGGRAALVVAPARPRRHARRARRRLDDRPDRLRRGDVPAEHPLGAGTHDARRAGRRGPRRQDGHRHPGGEEPRRRVPLAGARRRGPRACCDTLPPAEITNGLAEVVKTGLLAGEAVWELPRSEQVRRCAAFKAAICLRDPHDRAERTQLNLGHTFAHALEAASGLRAPARARGRARPARGAPPLGPRGRGRASYPTSFDPRRSRSTAMQRGPRSRATRRTSAARPGSCCSTHRGSRAGTSSFPPTMSARLSTS